MTDTSLVSRWSNSRRNKYSFRTRKAWTIEITPSTTVAESIRSVQLVGTVLTRTANRMRGVAYNNPHNTHVGCLVLRPISTKATQLKKPRVNVHSIHRECRSFHLSLFAVDESSMTLSPPLRSEHTYHGTTIVVRTTPDTSCTGSVPLHITLLIASKTTTLSPIRYGSPLGASRQPQPRCRQKA